MCVVRVCYAVLAGHGFKNDALAQGVGWAYLKYTTKEDWYTIPSLALILLTARSLQMAA